MDMRNRNLAKDESTKVKRMQVKKLTPDDLSKITGGCADTRDCTGPGGKTCMAYIVRDVAY
jgi:hypothetical protein